MFDHSVEMTLKGVKANERFRLNKRTKPLQSPLSNCKLFRWQDQKLNIITIAIPEKQLEIVSDFRISLNPNSIIRNLDNISHEIKVSRDLFSTERNFKPFKPLILPPLNTRSKLNVYE